MLKDGIHSMVDREKMIPNAKKLRDTYEMKKDAPIYMREFGFMSIDRWVEEGHISGIDDMLNMGLYDEGGKDGGNCWLWGLGWTESDMVPAFEEKVIEDRGDHEVVLDLAGRHVLFFKGRRNGFMPEYIEHPVKDIKTWEENIKPRLNPKSPERYGAEFQASMKDAIELAGNGSMIRQFIIGGYMYLRSLIGPLELLTMFYDNPELIHNCMETWLNLADYYVAQVQKNVTLDEIAFGEDICYKTGPLISPDMMKEFLFPYYQQLITNTKKRQIDKQRKLNIFLDTDGDVRSVIDHYKPLGFNIISPCEVAACEDVTEIAKKYPDLIIQGGIDKRILAEGKNEIDRMIDHIMPYMKSRGGYVPHCDHVVPEEVSFENYIHFRKRLLEYSK